MSEVRSALYPLPERPNTLGYIIGLGGRDVNPTVFKDIAARAQKEIDQGPKEEFHLYGVRG
jgi:hypothetical protein